VGYFICRDIPFLAPISWHSFGLNSCARHTAAVLLRDSSFTFVPDARPSGFGTPGKISTSRNAGSRNLAGPPQKARLVVWEQQPLTFSGAQENGARKGETIA
jgi:hypothetical protein